MHAQQATKAAQRENQQLSDLLKQAVQQLGLAITPSRSQAGTPEGRSGGESFQGFEQLAAKETNCSSRL